MEEKFLTLSKNSDGVMSCVYHYLMTLKASNKVPTEVAFYCDNCGAHK